MAKIPFTLEAWLKDKSQKVVDEDGRHVRIICTDADGLYPIIGLVDNKTPLPCGKDGRPPYIGGGGGTLFIVTPKEELTPFEKKVADIIDLWHEDYVQWSEQGASAHNYPDQIKPDASELLAIARDELFANDAVLKEYAEVSREQGKAEALITSATELTKNLANSGMDKDSIPYHLIEFMCNLYTCQNWKEIEETAEAYVTRIKAAALKDLPRWKKDKSFETEGTFMGVKGREYFIVKDGYSISVAELIKKLPGFKE